MKVTFITTMKNSEAEVNAAFEKIEEILLSENSTCYYFPEHEYRLHPDLSGKFIEDLVESELYDNLVILSTYENILLRLRLYRKQGDVSDLKIFVYDDALEDLEFSCEVLENGVLTDWPEELFKADINYKFELLKCVQKKKTDV